MIPEEIREKLWLLKKNLELVLAKEFNTIKLEDVRDLIVELNDVKADLHKFWRISNRN